MKTNAMSFAKMSVEYESFYLVSGEFFDPAFPVKCRFVRWLSVAGYTNCAMIAHAEVAFGKKKITEFVLLRKSGLSFNSVSSDASIGAYVFEVDERVQGDTLNLSDGLKNCQDWAQIYFSFEQAKTMVLPAQV